MNIYDLCFWVGRIVIFPLIRPLQLEKVVRLCHYYCKNPDFRQCLLLKMEKCPVLIYKLFKNGIFTFGEIEPVLMNHDNYILYYYFRREINDFDNFIHQHIKPNDIDEEFLKNDNDIDQMICYGFLPSSVEYCLKYDDIVVFRNINILDRMNVIWSPFEWSAKPNSYDLLSVSCFYGSVQCFKFLLMNGYNINDNVRSDMVFSGSHTIFQLCNVNNHVGFEMMCNASKYFRLSTLDYFIEYGADINAKNSNINFLRV